MFDSGEKYDAVLCLYDVVGSYADDADNQRILSTVSRHLKTGGIALMSVMNFELTRHRAKHTFALSKEPDRLLKLPPSRTMEKTGDIFDPDYYMVDVETNIVYRKEQFADGTSLPAELIVRDRRYERSRIEEMCKLAELEVLWSHYVRAGHWDQPLDPTHDKAKEILVAARKL